MARLMTKPSDPLGQEDLRHGRRSDGQGLQRAVLLLGHQGGRRQEHPADEDGHQHHEGQQAVAPGDAGLLPEGVDGDLHRGLAARELPDQVHQGGLGDEALLGQALSPDVRRDLHRLPGRDQGVEALRQDDAVVHGAGPDGMLQVAGGAVLLEIYGLALPGQAHQPGAGLVGDAHPGLVAEQGPEDQRQHQRHEDGEHDRPQEDEALGSLQQLPLEQDGHPPRAHWNLLLRAAIPAASRAASKASRMTRLGQMSAQPEP